MKVTELAAACVDALNHPERSLPDKPLVTLCGRRGLGFPRKNWPKSKRLLCVNSKYEYVYHYDAMDLLAAMVAHGLINLADEPSGSNS